MRTTDSRPKFIPPSRRSITGAARGMRLRFNMRVFAILRRHLAHACAKSSPAFAPRAHTISRDALRILLRRTINIVVRSAASGL